jgi:HlyD family secretion protein
MSDDATEPLVIPMHGPPRPPPIPVGRRLGRGLKALWPFTAWLCAVAAAGWLYFGESWRGHALAYDDIQEVKVSPSVAGRLATFTVEQGAKVDQGQPIATLDSGDLEARIRLAKTEIARLKTRVDAEREALRLETADRRSQAVVRRISYESEGRRLRGDLEKLVTEQSGDRAEADSFAPQIDRLKPLLEGKLITADRLEDVLRKRTVLERRIVARDEAIRETREELTAWQKLEPEKFADLGIEARLLPYELELRSQEAKVAELELDRAKYKVLSPVTGSIHVISTRPGEWCSVGQELAQIVVPRPGCLTAYLTDRQVPVVTVGTEATLRPRDRSGKALRGKVSMVGVRIEQVPLRLRSIPTIAQWGRVVSITVDSKEEPLPGEIYDVRFH